MPRKKPPPPKNPRGRPKIKIDLEQLARIASTFATIEQAAIILGCGRRTLLDRMRLDRATKDAWEDGLQRGKYSLKRLQWRHANGNGSAAVNMTIHMSKHHLGETDKAAFELSGPGGSPIQVVLSRDDSGLL